MYVIKLDILRLAFQIQSPDSAPRSPTICGTILDQISEKQTYVGSPASHNNERMIATTTVSGPHTNFVRTNTQSFVQISV